MSFVGKCVLNFVLLLVCFNFVSAQTSQEPTHHSCSTELTTASLELLSGIAEKAQSFVPEKQVTTIPVTVHIIRQSNGTGGATLSELEAAFDILNDQFSAAEMEFSTCHINTIADDDYYNFIRSDENLLTATYNVPGSVNLYIANSVTAGGAPICGFTHFPGEGGDQIILATACLNNGSTLAHEFGHYFGLYHTHGKDNSGTSDELNSGNNCVFGGDDVCDTPADPNLFGKVSACQYTGNDTDAEGQSYAPQVENIMSYAPADCRQLFSEGQLYRAAYILDTERSYLACGGLSAEFTADQPYSACGDPLTVTFTAVNTQATTWTWNFGDGITATNTTNTISYTYAEAGTYSVSLTVGDGTNYVSKMEAHLVQLPEQKTDSYTHDFNQGISHLSLVNSDQGNTWYPISDFNYTGNTVLCVNNYTGNQQNQEDILQTESYDMTDWGGAELSFKLSYMPLYYTSTFFIADELEVQYSTDCGVTYQTAYSKTGADLSTTTTIGSTRWYPQSEADWRTETISLPAELTGETVSFRIINRSGQGNFLYLDDFAVTKVSALPAELADFTAEVEGKGFIGLDWSTLTEKNVSHFAVEYSTEGIAWTEQAQVRAAGESDELQDYSYRSVFPAGDLFLRLKTEDNDGSFTYSNVIKVENEVEEASVFVYPNPVKDILNVRGEASEAYSLLDLQGNVLKQLILNTAGQASADISELAKGIYLLKNEEGKSVKVVKL